MIKEKIDEMAEKVYDLVKSGKYDVAVHLLEKDKKKVQIKTNRPTKHTKKWGAKNH